MSTQPPVDRSTTVAFCQNCGKPLTAEERRVVAQAVFCEPCLAERLAAAPPPPGGGYSYPGTPPGHTPPVAPPGPVPNPGFAALLGFIPGVGAMYNGQYAKGVVHLIVFAVLVSLSDQHGIFGLFVAGWVFYQVIEAYHTARSRRDGTPLPNPFGLNDLGERLGFGRSWPSPSATMPTAGGGTPPPYSGAEAPRPPDEWASSAWSEVTGTQPGGAAAQDPASAPPSQTAVPPVSPGGVYGSVPPAYEPVAPAYDPYAPRSAGRFPTGALWLIGLGVLFLIGNGGLFRGLHLYHLLPLLLIGVGAWMFVHKMVTTGSGFADDGSPGYRRRIFVAFRGASWVVLAGVLFFLDSAHILSLSRSWPLWIILAGVVTFLQRTIPPAIPSMPGSYGYPPQQPPAPAATAPIHDPGTGILVPPPHDGEGRQL